MHQHDNKENLAPACAELASEPSSVVIQAWMSLAQARANTARYLYGGGGGDPRTTLTPNRNRIRNWASNRTQTRTLNRTRIPNPVPAVGGVRAQMGADGVGVVDDASTKQAEALLPFHLLHGSCAETNLAVPIEPLMGFLRHPHHYCFDVHKEKGGYVRTPTNQRHPPTLKHACTPIATATPTVLHSLRPTKSRCTVLSRKTHLQLHP